MEKLRRIKIVSENDEIIQFDNGHHPDMRTRAYDACGNCLDSQRMIELCNEAISQIKFRMELAKSVEKLLNDKEE